jgi:hypothetical protein
MEQRYKTRNPKEVKEAISKVTDALGYPLDKDIIRAVVILNSLGLKTRQSCQGHLRRYNTYPWIALKWDAEKTPEYYKESRKIFFNTIFKDLEEFYQDRKVTYENILSFKFLDEKQLNVDLSSITNLKIFDKDRKRKLQEQFKELSDFCEYLNKKYHLDY